MLQMRTRYMPIRLQVLQYSQDYRSILRCRSPRRILVFIDLVGQVDFEGVFVGCGEDFLGVDVAEGYWGVGAVGEEIHGEGFGGGEVTWDDGWCWLLWELKFGWVNGYKVVFWLVSFLQSFFSFGCECWELLTH